MFLEPQAVTLTELPGGTVQTLPPGSTFEGNLQNSPKKDLSSPCSEQKNVLGLVSIAIGVPGPSCLKHCKILRRFCARVPTVSINQYKKQKESARKCSTTWGMV